LNGGTHSSQSMTEDSTVVDSDGIDVAEIDFLLQPVSDDAVGSNCGQGLTGLYNHGNTCYVNATIQALSNWYVCILVCLSRCL